MSKRLELELLIPMIMLCFGSSYIVTWIVVLFPPTVTLVKFGDQSYILFSTYAGVLLCIIKDKRK